jgi:hypothetical protein
MNLQKLMAGLKRKRMTQAQLAERLGLSPSAVSRWKHGENGTDEATRRKIEEILDLPAQELSSPAASVEDRLREPSPPYDLGRPIPAEAEAVLTLSWHGLTRQVALSRDALRQGENVLQAWADLDLIHRETGATRRSLGFHVIPQPDVNQVSSGPGVTAPVLAGEETTRGGEHNRIAAFISRQSDEGLSDNRCAGP